MNLISGIVNKETPFDNLLHYGARLVWKIPKWSILTIILAATLFYILNNMYMD